MIKTPRFTPHKGQKVLAIGFGHLCTGILIGWGEDFCTILPDKVRGWMEHYLQDSTDPEFPNRSVIQCSIEKVIPY